ncbi:unnamed protein product [Candida verbasci]|uniref:DUF2423 domain-containing protein n=1 Tax=Candida verbasci TaxID=1227364 RepID=A0A9W4TX20_9ASCO|nr:unnamed protein product [Candida verbasci]
MAKSLRSKSKLQAKSLKRKGEFAKYDDERKKRIADKLAKESKDQETEKKMDVDQDKKISTSGWRDSRSQHFKQKLNKKKRKTLKF